MKDGISATSTNAMCEFSIAFFFAHLTHFFDNPFCPSPAKFLLIVLSSRREPKRLPSSHTTVRTEPYTAVHGHCDLAPAIFAIGIYPISSMTQFLSTRFIACVLAILHGPLLLYATFRASASLSPSSISRFLRVRGFFHCRHRTSLTLRLIHPSSVPNKFLSSEIPK